MKLFTVVAAWVLFISPAMLSGAPVSFIFYGFAPSREFQFRLNGPVQIETSTDLAAWQPLTNAPGATTITDAKSVAEEWRFYRAKSGNAFAENAIGYARVPVAPSATVSVASPFEGAPLRLNNPSVRNQLFGTANPPITIYLQEAGKTISHALDPARGTFDPPLGEIPPGMGFGLRNNGSSALTISFMGEVAQGLLRRPLPPSDVLIAPLVPKPGPVQDDLGPTLPLDGARIFVFDEQKKGYVPTSYDADSKTWVPSLNYKPGRALMIKWPFVGFEKRFSVGP